MTDKRKCVEILPGVRARVSKDVSKKTLDALRYTAVSFLRHYYRDVAYYGRDEALNRGIRRTEENMKKPTAIKFNDAHNAIVILHRLVRKSATLKESDKRTIERALTLLRDTKEVRQ